MSGLAYYILDVETTGIKCGYHEITEISIIRCADKVQMTEMLKCNYPERANVDAMRITNKTWADLARGSERHDVLEKMDKFIKSDGLTPDHRVCVAHNYSFDKRFIHQFYKEYDREYPMNLWLCTMAMTKNYAKKAGIIKPKVNLQAACDIVGIKKYAAAHASKMDTRNTFLLWKDLCEQKGIDYLPMIKTEPHILNVRNEEEEPDMSLLEGLDD